MQHTDGGPVWTLSNGVAKRNEAKRNKHVVCVLLNTKKILEWEGFVMFVMTRHSLFLISLTLYLALFDNRLPQY
jgi:hypothetical protein